MENQDTNDNDLHRPTTRVLDILEYLANSQSGQSLTELASGISSSKSTIFPVIKTLVSRKYVFQDEDTLLYSLGARSCILASAFADTNAKLRMIKEEMRSIVEFCSEVCQLGILDGSDVLYIGKVESHRAVRLVSYVGKKLPATCTSLGKSLLSDHSDEGIKALYPNGLPFLTKSSIRDFDILRHQLDMVRDQGISFDDGESNDETRCYSVPLCQRGRIVAAISVSYPIFRDSEEKHQEIKKALFTAKQNIESMLNATEDVYFAG